MSWEKWGIPCSVVYWFGQLVVRWRRGEEEKGNVLLNVRTETLPSDDAQAKMGPNSCGAHAIAFTVNLEIDLGK